MKKLFIKISKIIARLSLSSAAIGAEVASSYGFYQPKVPNRISK